MSDNRVIALGRVFQACISDEDNGCEKCAFHKLSKVEFMCVKVGCTSKTRDDGKDVIFVEVQDERAKR